MIRVLQAGSGHERPRPLVTMPLLLLQAGGEHERPHVRDGPGPEGTERLLRRAQPARAEPVRPAPVIGS